MARMFSALGPNGSPGELLSWPFRGWRDASGGKLVGGGPRPRTRKRSSFPSGSNGFHIILCRDRRSEQAGVGVGYDPDGNFAKQIGKSLFGFEGRAEPASAQ
jgi:hypothetical protein